MSAQRLSLAAGSTASNVVRLPTSFQTWNGTGIACLLNFSGQGAAGGTAAAGNVTLQVSLDPNANPSNTPAVLATARWNNHDTLASITADKNSSIVYQCAYVRLVGTVTAGVVTCDLGYPDSGNP